MIDVNNSMLALTISGLMAQEELFREILDLQPSAISINIGVSDMMVENISWNKSDVPKLYFDRVHELMAHLYTYLVNSGFRGQFVESLTFTINMLPMYVACDAAKQGYKLSHSIFNLLYGRCAGWYSAQSWCDNSPLFYARL